METITITEEEMIASEHYSESMEATILIMMNDHNISRRDAQSYLGDAENVLDYRGSNAETLALAETMYKDVQVEMAAKEKPVEKGEIMEPSMIENMIEDIEMKSSCLEEVSRSPLPGTGKFVCPEAPVGLKEWARDIIERETDISFRDSNAHLAASLRYLLVRGYGDCATNCVNMKEAVEVAINYQHEVEEFGRQYQEALQKEFRLTEELKVAKKELIAFEDPISRKFAY